MEAQDRKNERLARKNPERIQKQIDDLKAVTADGAKLSRHQEQVLEGLEKEFRAVKKARDALGDKAPTFGRGWNRDSNPNSAVLGKRRRGSFDGDSSDDNVPDEVRRIPMPRDTPPPIPKDVLDEWYAKRRARREAEQAARRGDSKQDKDDTKDKPVIESRTVYEAKPIVRNLQKEAVAAFIPSAVQMKLNKGSGQGGLIEPEEADRLEKEGYMKASSGYGAPASGAASRKVTVEDVEDDKDE